MRYHEYGTGVRVIRNIRNDGTYPGEAVGALLVRRGTVGYVRDVGTFRDRVRARLPLAVSGEVVAAAGADGEVTRVLRDAPGGVAYEVLFTDRVLQVPETALLGSQPSDDDRPAETDRP